MARSIKDPEADRLARELADVTGESLTEAVTNALRQRLQLLRGDDRTPAQFTADVMAIVDRYASRPVVDARTADESSGDDER